VIDPKGDLANLLLTFPDLKPEDFAPWINLDDAARKGLSPADFAAQQAELWRSGLEKWGQDGARIQRMRSAAEFTVYTPGSNAGHSCIRLKSFDPPKGVGADDPELFRERVQATATSILGLAGIDADPVQSREHVLLSNLFTTAWQKGESLDLAGADPADPVSPRSSGWAHSSWRPFILEGSFQAGPCSSTISWRHRDLRRGWRAFRWISARFSIRRRESRGSRFSRSRIFRIPSACFFVTLLLNQTVAWMRQQPGTTSLRALFYMDEIFGYFPPVSNPPSKIPLLTLLKQARAYGLGVVLATQNPVDLDYKGLSNTGTWLIGRLQTERDKARVLEGLEGVSATAGGKFDRAQMGETLAGLGNRVFLLHNVHDDAPVTIESRWAMSYLRGR
jgi:hypothetical protein